jgi:hypothetical protein
MSGSARSRLLIGYSGLTRPAIRAMSPRTQVTCSCRSSCCSSLERLEDRARSSWRPPAEPWRSADVGIRDDRHRVLILNECWNVIGDVGSAARSSARKLAEAERLAVLIGGERPYRVAGCWVVRATRRNRELVARYPTVFEARFPGSSSWWVKALTEGASPPNEPGLVWCDVAGTRLYPWRNRANRNGARLTPPRS